MAAGAKILNDDRYSRVAVSVRPQDLDAVAGRRRRGVRRRGDHPAWSTRSATPRISEGDGILHANALRATGVDGTGVKVGVISDSYNKAAEPHLRAGDILSDNLPGATNTCGHTSVVHDRGPSRRAAPTRAAP